jgi:pyruvate ferredoxin oxidoreductase alpha subunit
MACRDTGWIQIFVENGQEAVDNTLCAFRIAEDQEVLLPVMIHLDGFHVSHVIESILLPEQSSVDAFLPPNNYPLPLDPAKPVAMGDFGPPVIYTEAKWAQEVNIRKSYNTILNVWQEFNKKFGRYYKPIECYSCEDADILLLTMGSFSETAMTAIDKIRSEGRKIGLIRIRLWRPFPFEELRRVLKDTKTLIVLDRAISFGGPGGPVCSEIRSALYGQSHKPIIVSFVGGLGGRDITVTGFSEIINRGIEVAENGSDNEFEIYGVRE